MLTRLSQDSVILALVFSVANAVLQMYGKFFSGGHRPFGYAI